MAAGADPARRQGNQFATATCSSLCVSTPIMTLVAPKRLVSVTALSSCSTKLAPAGRESGQDCEGAYGHAPCILVLVWDNHFTQADWGAADRLLLGHRRPSHSDGRRTNPEESPNSCLGQPSPHLARTGQSFTQEV